MDTFTLLNAESGLNQATVSEKPMVIGTPEVLKALDTLKKYKAGKARLDQKIVANEEWWKKRQWKYIHDGETSDRFEPATPWLFSCIQTRHADFMDAFPTCNIRPRQQDDKGEAKILSEIIPVILEQNDYEQTYSDVAWYLLKQGACCQGVFWDGTKHNGLGDISIKEIDFINLYWEPGITDIQKSTNVFYTELVDNSLLESKYPDIKGKLNSKPIEMAKYIYDDYVDTTEKSMVVDWYYKKFVNGKETLQFVKFVNDIVLYATENDTTAPTITQIDPVTQMPIEVPSGQSMAVRGLYDHAKYPFVVKPLFPIEGSLVGYGLTDIGRDTQMEIDLINQAVTENAIAGAKPRYFVRGNGNINEQEFLDLSKPLVHTNTSLAEEYVREIPHNQLDSMYVSFLESKINELKYCTSNQDANNGVAPSGVTSASGIAALQEVGGKGSRDANKAIYRAYREVILFVIELIRQFYDTKRTFRIVPDAIIGEQFVDYSNEGIKPQPQMNMGIEGGYRIPEFDVEVTTEKANPYKKIEVNELALQFYGNGFFNPEMSDQALGALEMMDFDQKDEVMNKIMQNGTLYEENLKYKQLTLQFARMIDPRIAEQLAKEMQGGGLIQPTGAVGAAELPGDTSSDEHPFVERARANARNSTI